MPTSLRERDDAYPAVVVNLNDRWRVIACRQEPQWILQKCKAESGHGRAWRGVRYFKTRKVLIEACARPCGEVDPAVQAILQELPPNFRRPKSEECVSENQT